MYSEKARELRRCQALTKDGERCQGWAVWGDELHRCGRHGGRVMEAHIREHTHYTPCRCVAYPFPHRPGSGLCKWPDAPEYRMVMRPGAHNIAYSFTRKFCRQPSQIAGWRYFGRGYRR